MKVKIEIDDAEVGQYVVLTVCEGVIIVDGGGFEEEPGEEEAPLLTAVSEAKH